MLEIGTLKILHVEDNQADAIIIKKTLQNDPGKLSGSHSHYNVDHVTDLASALKALEETSYNAVLLDMNLPDSRGIDNIRSIKETNPDVAIIVLTGNDDDELAVNVLHEGAQEFITKDNSHSPFIKRIINSSILRKAAEVELKRKAHFDTLTGLPNRLSFENTVRSIMKRAQRWERHEGLMFIDLDGFKAVNDTYGHEAGNEVLKIVAGRLKDTMRGSDIIARYAGDEFVIYLDSSGRTHIDYDKCMAIAEKVIKAIEAPMHVANKSLKISLSIGISIYPNSGSTFEDLLKNADDAMYRAKRDPSRQCYVVGEDEGVGQNGEEPQTPLQAFCNSEKPRDNSFDFTKSGELKTYANDKEKQVRTVLIIDDSAEDSTIYRSMLKNTRDENIEYKIFEAETMREGRRLAEKHEPDCILLDYLLPDMRGIEYLKNLDKQDPPLRSAIVMITGQEDRSVAVEAMKLGAKDYIVKGEIDAERFINVINSAIEKAELEDTLRRYRNELERSNTDLSEFAHIVAHDLKAPMRKISTFCDILKSDHTKMTDADAKHCIDRIQVSSKRMQNLINNLLVLAEMGHKKEERTEVDLARLARNTVDDLGLLIEETDAKVTIKDLPIMHVYPVRLQQALNNLVSNALKYRKQGEKPNITIGALPASTNPDTFILSVSDNGIGIPKAYLEKVFSPFQRLHGADDIEGTGLGLSICKKAADYHGGKLWADSKEGVGTTFYISIPKSTEKKIRKSNKNSEKNKAAVIPLAG